MKLYIHFGIYKAGSSYLQYVSIKHKEFLKINGFYFPSSAYDSAMLSGQISPGNAKELHDLLNIGNRKIIVKLFKGWQISADKAGCSSVLITAESLVHNLANEHQLSLLEEIANDNGFDEVHAMGYFRNLSEHALSTYKHRGKSGKIPDYETWLEHVYETPYVIERLLHTVEYSSIVWQFRLFKKDSDYMLKVFFNDWLQIEKPELPERPKVNESVTLSEIRVMNKMHEIFPSTTDIFVNEFKRLESREKATDEHLDRIFLSVAFTILSKHQMIINELNKYLPKGDKLLISDKTYEKIDKKYENTINLSDDQLNIISASISFLTSFKGKMMIFRRQVLSLFPNQISQNYKKLYRINKKRI